MITENQIAAVELHKEVLNGNKLDYFHPKNYLAKQLKLKERKFLTQKN